MKKYLNLMKNILTKGIEKTDRTKVGTISIFGQRMSFDLSKGFPLVTTKKVNFSSIVAELLWFLRGDTDVKYLEDHNIKIWSPFANENRSIGPMYGEQWMRCNGQINQIEEVIKTLKTNPNSRRMIVCSWNVSLIPRDETVQPKDNPKNGLMSLAPCHTIFQFYVANGKLSCLLFQRSADMFIGVPFNIASYSLLVYIIADITNLIPGSFVWIGGDCHIYNNHINQVKTQLSRKPFPLPQLKIHKKISSIDDFMKLTVNDFSVENYQYHERIFGELNV
jgi:thymidylate synthase